MYPELRPDAKLARALAATHGREAGVRALAEMAAADYEALRLPETAKEARSVGARSTGN